MKVKSQRSVKIEFELRDQNGVVLESTAGTGPVSYVHGSGELVPGLERQLEGKHPGQSFDVVLEPADAYGQRAEGKVREVSRDRLGLDLEPQVGMTVTLEEQRDVAISGVIVEVNTDTVWVDANHRYAGQTLRYTGKVRAVKRPRGQCSCCKSGVCSAVDL